MAMMKGAVLLSKDVVVVVVVVVVVDCLWFCCSILLSAIALFCIVGRVVFFLLDAVIDPTVTLAD
jgi:hypothetical protein